MPINDHKLPAVNSPSINPRKKGIACWCILSPPNFKINNLSSQLTKRHDQITFMPQLVVMANPAGWKGHQKNFILIIIKNTVEKNPTIVNIDC